MIFVDSVNACKCFEPGSTYFGNCIPLILCISANRVVSFDGKFKFYVGTCFFFVFSVFLFAFDMFYGKEVNVAPYAGRRYD